MTQPTDTQLKQALAKMLPDACNIKWLRYYPSTKLKESLCYCWPNSFNRKSVVRDTELLHLCWLVEESMNAELYINKYIETLYLECGNGRAAAHASWQQRTIALCKVKGVEIV